MFSILLNFADLGLFGKTEASVIDSAQLYLERLLKTVPPKLPTTGVQLDSHELTTGSGGLGYYMRDTEAFEKIRQMLVKAIHQVQISTRAERLEILLNDLEEEPSRYWLALNGGDSSRDIPRLKDELIFVESDANTIANRVLSMHPSRWANFLSPMKERIERQIFLQAHRNDGRLTEAQWLLDFRKAAMELSESATPIKKQQIIRVLKGHLDFLDAPVETPPILNTSLNTPS